MHGATEDNKAKSQKGLPENLPRLNVGMSQIQVNHTITSAVLLSQMLSVYLKICLTIGLIYGLFNNNVSISDYTAMNGRMNNELDRICREMATV